jgi:PAS domain S-box-containing protein
MESLRPATESRVTAGQPGFAVRDTVRRLAMSLILVACALVLTLFLQRFFPYPFLFLFFAAVMASAWLGGTAAGLFAVLFSTIAVDYFFVPPFYSFSISPTAEAYFGGFVVCALAASWVSTAKKKDEEELTEARDHLERRVSERTAALQKSNIELQERERQLRLLTEVIPQQIWCATPVGSIDYCNQQLLDYAGRGLLDMQGERFSETLHPEDREGFHRSWQRALASGEQFEGQWRVRGADGEYQWFFTRGLPLRGADGRILRWYGTNTNIDGLHKAEQSLMKTQSDVAHLSRVLSMGELSTSIAHEISQPLTAVVTHGNACVEWLNASPPNVEKARTTAERIIQDGTRAGAVLSHIRALFKKGTPAKGCVDMNEVIHELTVFLKDEAIGRQVSLRAEVARDLPLVDGDRVQLQQVVLNLAMNGMDAMKDLARGPKELRIAVRREGASQILVSVEDSGIGLSAETAEKIFQPFFTTKPQGIGMGLSISRSIIESHAGRLWASPRPGGGALFQFTLPVRSENADDQS